MPPSRVPLLFGLAGFGTAGATDITRTTDVPSAQKLIDIFTDFGGKELDTARVYGMGTSEELVSKLNLRGASVDTKCYPMAAGAHSPEKLRETLLQSVNALKPHKIRIFYLHAPDRTVPYEQTLAEVNKLHKEGLFEAFGLSNFYSFEVAQIYTICKERGYVLPTVYQGPYSLLARTNEAELFPTLRAFNIRFVAYSVLAGGLFKGDPKRPGGRYDPSTAFGPFQVKVYTEGKQYEAIQLIKDTGAKHSLSVGEIALRWIQHHSELTPSDGVILGASSESQMTENCRDSQKGPLPEDVVQTIEHAWLLIKSGAAHYGTGHGTIKLGKDKIKIMA